MRYAKRLASMFALSLFAVACGGEFTSSLPTGPSGTATGGATINGVVNGMSSASTAWSTPSGSTANTSPAGITVTVAGTNLSTTVSGTGTFTLTGVPSGTVQLRFTGPGVDATLTITGVTTEQIQIVITLSGSNANVDSMNREQTGNAAEVEGLISSISYGDRSMKVAGVEVKVRNAPIRYGSTEVGLTTLTAGHRVYVKGTREHDYIVATEVILKDMTPSPNAGPSPDAPSVEFQGLVKGLAGTCPSVTFKVNETSVTTSPATSFRTGPCGHLEEGTSVKVQGRRQADGSVLAEKVEMKEVKFTGPITVATGACPALTLTVNGSTVKTDAWTVFEKLACGGFGPNLRVEVVGTEHPNGVVKAIRLKYEGQ
jgi:hypothetical protein